MLDEGYIKFQCDWEPGPAPKDPVLSELLKWRDKLYQSGYIGYDSKHKVGFGNISVRTPDDRIIISGTQTGHHPQLNEEHLTEIIEASTEQNRVLCRGPLRASSETLTHVALYEWSSHIRGILHIHDTRMWEQGIHELPATAASVPYGTPEMALEIHRLCKAENWNDRGLLAMAGHQDGIIAFGPSLQEAGELLFNFN